MKQSFNVNLEALRGYAAIFVVLGHLIALPYIFNPQYTPMPLVVFGPSSHLFLLVFFVLSGYVITSSNKGITNASHVVTYVKKRFLRIYPIYFVALVITLIIADHHYTAKTIVWNFALMQDLIVQPFAENAPTWSLHFEMLFYLLFVPLVFFRLNYFAVFMLSILIALANFYFYPNVNTPIISAYLFGFAFWMGGACIAKYLSGTENTIQYNTILSALFLILATDQMVFKSGLPELTDNVAYLLFKHHLQYPTGADNFKTNLGYKDLAFLPYCLFTVLVFSGRKSKYEHLFFIILILPLIFSVYIAVTQPQHNHATAFLAPVLYFCIAVFTRYFNFPLLSKAGIAVIQLGTWLGSISYGVYIIHLPLLFLIGKLNFFNNQIISYTIKMLLLLTLVVSMAYLLEKIYQPWIRKILSGKKQIEDVKP